MKTLISFLLFTSIVHARPHSLIDCKPTEGQSLSAKFVYDYFDDKYSHVTVLKNNTKLFSLSGDTSKNPCLEVDMSAGADTAETYRDIIAVFGVHELRGCQGPFHSVALGAKGKNSSNVVTGQLTVGYLGKFESEKVRCVLVDIK